MLFSLIVERDILKKYYHLNEYVIISGKINFYKNKYQITNPTYVNTLEKVIL